MSLSSELFGNEAFRAALPPSLLPVGVVEEAPLPVPTDESCDEILLPGDQDPVPSMEEDPALESGALSAFCRKDCSASLPGWCKADSRNAFVSVDVMDRCPRDPQRIGRAQYRIVPNDESQTNAAFFGCSDCPSRKIDNGVELCGFDPSLLRRIDTWGWCPRLNADGPIQGWKRGFTPKYSGSIDQEEENS